ncbi:MAG: glycosyltransferase family 1 protein [Patescibacteria group bacterium]
MNIAIDARPLLERRGTGVYEYTRHLLDALFRISNDDFTLFSNSYQYSPRLPEDWREMKNIKVFETKKPNKIFNLKQRFLQKPKFNAMARGADLFYLPNLNFCSFDAGFPHIATVHDLSFEVNPQFFSPKQLAWHRLINIPRLLRGATKIAAVSRHTKDDIVKLFGISPDKIEVVYPGLNMLKDGLPAAEMRLRHFLPENFILYLGTVERRKNISGLIQAFRMIAQKIPDYFLTLAGSPGPGFREIYELARSGAASERILFLDYIPEAERKALYSLAKVFVYPSFYEGFGMPPLEAMSCGIPVVASAASSIPEVAGGAAMLVNPYNVSELAEAMLEGITNERLRKSLISRGYEHIKKFSWEKAATELNDIFQKII